jgi:hypothetical protein
VPSELGVRRAIHLTHPTAAKHRQDFVSAEAGARTERHERCGGRIIRLSGHFAFVC